jgi:hypothetical protein
MTTTIRDLRTILFDIDNQEMTVKQLRNLLFDQLDQDQTIRRGTLADIEQTENERAAAEKARRAQKMANSEAAIREAGRYGW